MSQWLFYLGLIGVAYYANLAKTVVAADL